MRLSLVTRDRLTRDRAVFARRNLNQFLRWKPVIFFSFSNFRELLAWREARDKPLSATSKQQNALIISIPNDRKTKFILSESSLFI